MLASVLRFIRGHLSAEGAAMIADPMRVMSTGIAGAGRLHGLETDSRTLVAGSTMSGGVIVHRLRRRSRSLRP
jgi:hypothetical protein